MEERIANNVKILYALGFFVMEGYKQRAQNTATSKIIETFEKSIPCPVSISYIFENPNDEEYIMVEFMRDGTCAMRIPTSNEINNYFDSRINFKEA